MATKLLDVMMPRIDGPTTLSLLRKLPALARTPVIFLTARVSGDDAASYLALGALGLIAKPFEPRALPGHIRALVARSERPSHPPPSAQRG